MPTVLITDSVHPIMEEGLEALGFQSDYRPAIGCAEVHDIIHGYEGLVVNSKIIVDKALLDKAVGLRFIARLGSGMETIDQGYARQKGIHVINSPEGNRNAVAEQALGSLLMLANQLRRADAEVRRFHWDREKNRGFEVQGKTIGIIGFGHAGGAFGGKLAGLGMEVLSYDKYKQPGYTRMQPHVRPCSLEELQSQADIVSFHLPLNYETRHMLNAGFLSKCRHGVIIINTSRGGIVDTEALVAALESGRVGGACLDVFENEKPHTFTASEKALYGRLYQLEQVVLSPHIAGWTVESKYKLSKVILDKLAAVM